MASRQAVTVQPPFFANSFREYFYKDLDKTVVLV